MLLRLLLSYITLHCLCFCICILHLTTTFSLAKHLLKLISTSFWRYIWYLLPAFPSSIFCSIRSLFCRSVKNIAKVLKYVRHLNQKLHTIEFHLKLSIHNTITIRSASTSCVLFRIINKCCVLNYWYIVQFYEELNQLSVDWIAFVLCLFNRKNT